MPRKQSAELFPVFFCQTELFITVCFLLQANHLSPRAHAIPLEWGAPLPSELKADQNSPQLILASDLVYTPAAVQPLLVTLDQLVTGPDSLVLLASEMREGAGLEDFHKGLAKFGFQEQLVSKGLRGWKE